MSRISLRKGAFKICTLYDICLSVSLCISVHSSDCLTVYLSTYLKELCLGIFLLWWTLGEAIHHLSIHPSIIYPLSIHLSIHYPSIYLSIIHLSMYTLSIHPFIYPSIQLPSIQLPFIHISIFCLLFVRLKTPGR